MILFEIYCYFLKNILTVLIVYVDIIIVTCDDPKEVKNIKRMLATEFEINHLRDSKYFLGIEVTSRGGNSCSRVGFVSCQVMSI